jgi:hypothetical protein
MVCGGHVRHLWRRAGFSRESFAGVKMPDSLRHGAIPSLPGLNLKHQ